MTMATTEFSAVTEEKRAVIKRGGGNSGPGSFPAKGTSSWKLEEEQELMSEQPPKPKGSL